MVRKLGRPPRSLRRPWSIEEELSLPPPPPYLEHGKSFGLCGAGERLSSMGSRSASTVRGSDRSHARSSNTQIRRARPLGTRGTCPRRRRRTHPRQRRGIRPRWTWRLRLRPRMLQLVRVEVSCSIDLLRFWQAGVDLLNWIYACVRSL
jgi:hypothetical protein